MVATYGESEALLKRTETCGRPLSEAIAVAQALEAKRGNPAVLDPDFAADIQEIVRSRKTSAPTFLHGENNR